MANHEPDQRYRRGAGIVLFNAQAQVWVGQRIDNPGPAWQMPQGGIDPKEDPKAAAFRELEEETSVPASACVEAGSSDEWMTYEFPDELRKKLWRGSYVGQAQRWFGLQLTGDENLINIDTKHPEFSHWKWVELEETVDLIVPFKRELYSKVVRAFLPIRDQLRTS